MSDAGVNTRIHIWCDQPNEHGFRIYYWAAEGAKPPWPGRISLKGAIEAAKQEYGANIRIVFDYDPPSSPEAA